MKILMTTDTVGGVWIYSVELCKALAQHNIEIHLAAMGSWPNEHQQKQIAEMSHVTLYKSDYKLEWMEEPWEDVEQAQKWINSIYQTVHPDLVHLNNYAQIQEDWTCPTLTVFHSCVQTWWQAVKGTAAPATWNTYTDIVKHSLAASDVVVTPTKAILKKAKDTHQFSSRTAVINNGREIAPFEEKEKQKIILCIGRIWDEAKNLELLSGIATELSWPVYIAGNNRNPSTGKKKDFENVIFLGELEPQEVQEWMQRASIFVSPTKYEPFGLAVLEAAKSGCALVLSELETLTELWGGAAEFFDPKDSDQAKEKILQLINNKELREEMSRKSQARSEEYSSEKMATAYVALYRDLINKQKTKKLMSV